MRFFSTLLFIGVLGLFVAGCGSPSGRVKVANIAPAEQVEIEMFDIENPPEKAFREIAILSYDGVAGEYLDAVRQFRLKARELGANAIMLDDPISYAGDRHPYEHFMFRAIAIVYDDRRASR